MLTSCFDSAKTRDLISGEQFNQLKKGVVIINTSRGEVVNIQALVRAIAEGGVAGAGLDVLPEEPVIREEAELLRSVYEQRHDLETAAGQPRFAASAQRRGDAAQRFQPPGSRREDFRRDSG
jgi:lactate dehydrogenase-like 2-hydroxyacid dehydrogenase